MSKIIIGIHGLGNKPSKNDLEEWWFKAICEGLKKIDRFKFEPNFELVYWADILNDKPLNKLITDPKNPYFLDEPYSKSAKIIDSKPHTTRQKFLGFLEGQMDKLFLNDDLSSNFEFISDIVFKKYFKELEIYYARKPEINDASYKSVKDIIRNRLAEKIQSHKSKEIILVAHSMGSIIAYDVSNFLVPQINIDTFVTMGSPLGIPIIISKIAQEFKVLNPEISKLTTPQNVKGGWYNYSDIEDNIALNYNLGDDFEVNSSNIKVIDTIIKNDYAINGERNPHKSYGYLRAPEFSNLLADFLEKDCSKPNLWYLEKSYLFNNWMKKLFYRFSNREGEKSE